MRRSRAFGGLKFGVWWSRGFPPSVLFVLKLFPSPVKRPEAL